MSINNRLVAGATRTIKRIVPLLGLAVALLAMPAAADLVGLYTFDRANPFEAVIGSPAKEGVSSGDNQAATLTDTITTLSMVTDAAALGDRTGVIAVPSRSTLAVPNPGLQKDWTITFWFYAPDNAAWRCFFQFVSPENSGDGSLFIRNNADIGAQSYTTGILGIVGAWHQLTVSSANNTQTIWYDQRKLDQTRSWNLAGMSLLQFSLDNNGEDATMYFDEIRLYDETAPAEVFPDGLSEGPVLLGRWLEPPYSDQWGSFSREPDLVIDDLPYRTYVFSRHCSFTFTPNKASADAEILVVGGGGAGGMLRGGGGGGGGVVQVSSVTLAAQTYTATVGAGGIPDIHPKWYSDKSDTSRLHPGASTAATCGGESFVKEAAGGTVVAAAAGGGGGGCFNYSGVNLPAESYGLDGGSGGGASGKSTTPGNGIDGQGYAGGKATTDGDNTGGGGGGAGGPGTNGSKNLAGDGGPGIEKSITGSPVFYGGGGGASSYNSAGGVGGTGGGGTGVSSTAKHLRSTSCNGADGLGGGGGGGSGQDNNPYNTMGGRGGDGTVILRVTAVDEDAPEPTIALVADPVGYTNATLSARLVMFGAGASSATVSLVVSANQDLSDPVFSGVLATDTEELATFQHTLVGLVTNTAYYARATATNNRGVIGSSALAAFVTLDPQPAAGRAVFAWRGYRSIAAIGTLTDFGAGSESALFRLEASTDGFETLAATPDLVATSGLSEMVMLSGLLPETNYELRFRFSNEWGRVSYVPVADSYSTREAPLSTSGIGYRFSDDLASVDFTFGITEVYDGATLTATLSYDGKTIGTQSASEAGTLSWPSVAAAAKVATATVTVVSRIGSETVTTTWEIPVTPGAAACSVGSLSELRAAPVHPGDAIVLPELTYVGEYYQLLDIRPFEIGADGVTLVAREPGFTSVAIYRRNPISGKIERDATMGLAICAPRPAGSGRVFLAVPTSGTWDWAESANWTNLTGDEPDYPRLADDVAIAPLANSGQLRLRSDATVGELFIGWNETAIPGENNATIRLSGENAATLTFESTDRKRPALLRVTGLSRRDVGTGFPQFRLGNGGASANSIAFIAASDLVWDCGAWPDYTDTTIRNVHNTSRQGTEHGRFFRIDASRTLRILNMTGYKNWSDDQGENAQFSLNSDMPFTGSGTIVYEGPGSVCCWAPFQDFEGTLVVRNKQKFDTYAMGSRGGSFWVGKGAKAPLADRATLVVEGDVAYDNGLSHNASYGVISYGNSHGYGSWSASSNAFPAKAWVFNGGVARISGMSNTGWGSPPIAVPLGAEKLVVSNGFFSVQLFNSQGADRPTNVLHFASLEHAGAGVLHVKTDRLWNSYNKSLARDFVVLEGFAGHAIGGTGVATYSTTDSDAANILDANAPIVPWIVGSVQDSRNLYFPGAASDGVLVLGGHPATQVLNEVIDPTENVKTYQSSLALDHDVTVNSLVVQDNRNKEFRLGAARKLTITSGGLVVGNSEQVRIGTEAGLADGSNGTILFPSKAYVYSVRQSASSPNEIWAPMVSAKGAVFSYPGDLRIGGDQTGIDGRISVNGTRLQLGSSTAGCEIDVPVHVYGASAKIAVNKEGSFCRQELYFWDHGTPGSKFVPLDGSAERVQKLYIDGVSMPRGTYGATGSGAQFIDDNHFSGTGVARVLRDDLDNPIVIRLK